jgi:choline-glycine betaine transporter
VLNRQSSFLAYHYSTTTLLLAHLTRTHSHNSSTLCRRRVRWCIVCVFVAVVRITTQSSPSPLYDIHLS